MSKDKKDAVQFDCSARFYPIMATKKAQSLYHIALRLDHEIDSQLLARAVEEVLPHFPTFATKLKRGYAWYYLTPNSSPVPVVDFDGRILRPLDKKETNGYLFRFCVNGDELHIDFFHGLADGTGSLAFVLAVVRRMRQLKGKVLPDDAVTDVTATPTEEQSEDAFLRYYSPIKLGDIDLKGMAGGVPSRRRGTLVDGGYGYSHFVADGAQLVGAAKAAGASFTAYVAAIAAYCLEKLADDKKPIALMIPVNLRASFPSATQRNFVLFVRIVIEQGTCKCLEDYVAQAKEQLAAGTQKERLRAQIATTVKGMTLPAMNAVPVCLKRFASKVGKLFMRSRQTIIISNLGRIAVSDEYGIKELIYNLNVSPTNVQNLAITSFGGKTVFSFTSAIKEDAFEREFVTVMKERGVDLEPLKWK